MKGCGETTVNFCLGGKAVPLGLVVGALVVVGDYVVTCAVVGATVGIIFPLHTNAVLSLRLQE